MLKVHSRVLRILKLKITVSISEIRILSFQSGTVRTIFLVLSCIEQTVTGNTVQIQIQVTRSPTKTKHTLIDIKHCH